MDATIGFTLNGKSQNIAIDPDRPLPSAGAGETPIIAIAPAIANAVYRATGKSLQRLPVRLEKDVVVVDSAFCIRTEAPYLSKPAAL